MTGRFDLSARGAAAPRQTGMPRQDKLKLAAAVALLVVGGGWICNYLGVFNFESRPDPSIPMVDGKPVKPEDAPEQLEKIRNYKDANDQHTKDVGPPGRS